MRYILVVIDNFSRYMMTVALTDKTAAKTAVGYGRCSTRLNRGSVTQSRTGWWSGLMESSKSLLV